MQLQYSHREVLDVVTDAHKRLEGPANASLQSRTQAFGLQHENKDAAA